MQITRADLRRFFPHGGREWIEVLARDWRELCALGDVTTAERWCHMMAQVHAETGGLSLKNLRESLAYSPQRILEVFDYRLGLAQRSGPYKGRTKSAIALLLAADRQALAETVYGGRRELGNTQPGDGHRYIGRGPLQTTGRGWYERIGKEIGIDVAGKPEALENPDIGWRAAFTEWRLLDINRLADSGNVEAVSRKLNGGTNGMKHRKSAFARAMTIWPDADLQIDAPPSEPAVTPRLADPPPPDPPASPAQSSTVVNASLVGVGGVSGTGVAMAKAVKENRAADGIDWFGLALTVMQDPMFWIGVSAVVSASVVFRERIKRMIREALA